MLYEALVDLIGEVPPGFDPLVYVCAAIILVWLLNATFSILWSVLGFIGGK